MELFIFVYSDYNYDSPTLSINIPTRRVGEEAFLVRNNCAKRFGLHTEGGKDPIVETYNESAAFPLVRGWMRYWGKEISYKSRRVLSINSKSITPKDPTSITSKTIGRSTHYIADWAAGFVGFDGDIDHYLTVKHLRPNLGHKLFERLHYSDIEAGNITFLADAFRSIVSVEKPQLETAVSLLCLAPLVEAAGRRRLPQVWESDSQEEHWLWAIFPHIQKANGSELRGGL